MKARAGIWALALAVAAAHLGLFWFVANKHFLPSVRSVAPPAAPDFAARETITTNPDTGETQVTREYAVSTHLQAPSPVAAGAR